jgi:predicted PurR-regulated permease PerM
MEQSPTNIASTPPRSTFIDMALRIGLVAMLVFACLRIIAPFVGILSWSVILAVMLWPLHKKMAKRLGNSRSAWLIGLAGVVLLMAPLAIAVTSLGSSILGLMEAVKAKTLVVPPPPPRLADLPLVGHKLTDAWQLLATNMPAAMAKYGDVLKEPATKLAKFAAGLAVGELSFMLSFAFAAIMVAYGERAAGFAEALFTRVTGNNNRGARLTTLTAATIRGVAQGVVGVAVVQSVLIGIGFFAIGLPWAGLLTLVVLLLGIVQVPAALVVLPAIAYVFSTEPTTPAVIFAVWSLLAGLSDNVLKPLLLGRGLEVPMPVILVGVIGGMIVDGLVGLFVGPVVLGVGYMLFSEWMRQPQA